MADCARALYLPAYCYSCRRVFWCWNQISTAAEHGWTLRTSPQSKYVVFKFQLDHVALQDFHVISFTGDSGSWAVLVVLKPFQQFHGGSIMRCGGAFPLLEACLSGRRVVFFVLKPSVFFGSLQGILLSRALRNVGRRIKSTCSAKCTILVWNTTAYRVCDSVISCIDVNYSTYILPHLLSSWSSWVKHSLTRWILFHWSAYSRERNWLKWLYEKMQYAFFSLSERS